MMVSGLAMCLPRIQEFCHLKEEENGYWRVEGRGTFSATSHSIEEIEVQYNEVK